jgi:hypothetical protein
MSQPSAESHVLGPSAESHVLAAYIINSDTAQLPYEYRCNIIKLYPSEIQIKKFWEVAEIGIKEYERECSPGYQAYQALTEESMFGEWDIFECVLELQEYYSRYNTR